MRQWNDQNYFNLFSLNFLIVKSPLLQSFFSHFLLNVRFMTSSLGIPSPLNTRKTRQNAVVFANEDSFRDIIRPAKNRTKMSRDSRINLPLSPTARQAECRAGTEAWDISYSTHRLRIPRASEQTKWKSRRRWWKSALEGNFMRNSSLLHDCVCVIFVMIIDNASDTWKWQKNEKVKEKFMSFRIYLLISGKYLLRRRKFWTWISWKSCLFTATRRAYFIRYLLKLTFKACWGNTQICSSPICELRYSQKVCN